MPKPRFASNDPDKMLEGGGLPTNFLGTITEARYVKWTYPGREVQTLAVRLTIDPDEGQDIENWDGGPVVQHYSAGSLEFFVPSDSDGDEQEEGTHALAVGKADDIRKGTNWHHFLEAAKEAGLDQDLVTPDLSDLEGVHGRFDRMPQKARSGIVVAEGEDEGKKQFPKTILLLTQVVEKGSGKKAQSSKAASTSKETKSAANGLDAKIEEALAPILAKAKKQTISKREAAQALMKAFTGPERSKAVKRLDDEEFYNASEAILYDAEEGTLTQVQ